MRTKPWTSLQALAIRAGWDARISLAENSEWRSIALRARSAQGQRVIGLWRGRSLDTMRFTSAMTWGPDLYFTVLSAAQLREVLRGA